MLSQERIISLVMFFHLFQIFLTYIFFKKLNLGIYFIFKNEKKKFISFFTK